MTRPESANRPKAVPARGARFLKGLLVGMVLGVALSAAVAIYVTRMPSPFVAHSTQASGTPDKPAAEMPEISRHGLINPSPAQPDSTPATAPEPQGQAAPATQTPSPADSSVSESAPKAAEVPPASYFVQTGAFQKGSEADNQRATLALLGMDATILSPEVGEKPLYRVRIGPIVSVDEVRAVVATLKNSGISTTVIKVKSKSAAPR